MENSCILFYLLARCCADGGRVAQPFGFRPHRAVRAAFPHTVLPNGKPKAGVLRITGTSDPRAGAQATFLGVPGVGADETLSRPLGLAQEKMVRWNAPIGI